ncbi:MAG: hypothetical protein OHK0022_61170 [Roseiflexaceae bacterium]
MGYRRNALIKRQPAFTAPETTLAPAPLLTALAPHANIIANAQPQTDQATAQQEQQALGHDFSQITIYDEQREAAAATPTPPAAPAAPPGDDTPESGGEASEPAGPTQAQPIALPDSGMVAQTALRVNAPGDRFEQEADQLAARVMQMPPVFAPGQSAPEPATPSMQVQRSSDAGVGVAPPAVEAGIGRLQSGGAPLPASERAFFEPRMGVDLSQVRIQNTREAAEISQSLQARAFTVGNTIAFDLGEYQPGTEQGRHLLAHELVHTVQQTGGVAAKRNGLSIQRTTWDRGEGTIWVPDFGRQYEERYGANIAGNYPTIDHFDTSSGLAVSLKTINLIDNYQLDGGAAQLEATISDYINTLKDFIPRTYAGISIPPESVKALRLQIAIPPRERCPKPELFDMAMGFNGPVVNRIIALNQRVGRLGSLRSSKKLAIHDKMQTESSGSTSSDAMDVDSGEGSTSSALPVSNSMDTAGVTLEVKVEARDDLDWGPGPGNLYEQATGVNIGGTFPTIDDFRDGVATSLKTVNIVENYASVRALKTRIEQYIDDLQEFKGRAWPLGNNHTTTDPSLITMIEGKPHISVPADGIRRRVLQLGIPPVSALLEQRDRLHTGKTPGTAATDSDVELLQEKYNYIKGLHGKQQGQVTIQVEERE